MNITARCQQWSRKVRPETPPSHRQGGVVLVIALIVMVAMTLASIAMVRSVDTSTLIAGNLAFKQSATASGDAGVEAAIAWLADNSGSLEQDSASNGYYATSQICLDLTGNGNLPDDCTPPYTVLDWSNASAVKTLAKDGAGNEATYIIHRLCNSAGPLDGATCTVEETAQGGNSQGSARQMTTYQPGSWTSVANRGYYRITVRIAGPRNNYSYVQAIVSQ